MTACYLSYWAKADDATPAGWHPVAYHGLDVAACAAAVLEAQPDVLARLAALLDCPPDAARGLATFLIALHDIGKFSPAFQALRPDVVARTRPGDDAPIGIAGIRHDRIAHKLWTDHLCDDPAIARRLAGWCDDPIDFDPLVSAIAGHHGRPVDEDLSDPPIGDIYPEAARDAATGFARDAAALLLPAAPARPIATHGLEAASWLLAGLCTLADWLGSNPAWFAYAGHARHLSLQAYWDQRARPGAAAGLRDSGIASCPAAPATGFQALFPELAHHDPSPLQRHAEQVPIEDGPQIHVLEDHAGAGKTEAALILAHRLAAAGRGAGYYFALPTMATANAMYARIGDVHARLFAPSSAPSLVLAQSARTLNDRFMASIRPAGSASAAPDTSDAGCADWIADNRKKSLLAQVGVGTVDQALIAVLPKKHQCLRLYGAAQKILIVDEVHAYDSYMSELLCRLLQFHARLGGSAILLSATIPLALRQRLLDAFARGRGRAATPLSGTAFPLATRWAAGRPVETPVTASGRGDRTIRITTVASAAQVQEILLQGQRDGAALCWVRNTVQEAQDAYHALLAAGADPARTALFHARMALGDRLAAERAALATFGKHAPADARRGQILIATQVVEQSLDVDFDELISDLCPIDLLIQRAGRQHRHARAADGRLAPDGRDRRDPPVLRLLSQPATDDDGPDWLAELSRGTTYVYPDRVILWLTQLGVQDGVLDLRSGPDGGGPRRHIEGVYDAARRARAPEGVRAAAREAMTQQQDDAAVARRLALRPEAGYAVDGKAWGRDGELATRLGEPTVDVYLARLGDDGRLLPLIDHRHAWAMSRLSVRQSLVAHATIADPTARSACEALARQRPHLFADALIMPLRPRPGGGYEALLRTPRARFTYTHTLGLCVQRGR